MLLVGSSSSDRTQFKTIIVQAYGVNTYIEPGNLHVADACSILAQNQEFFFVLEHYKINSIR